MGFNSEFKGLITNIEASVGKTIFDTLSHKRHKFWKKKKLNMKRVF